MAHYNNHCVLSFIISIITAFSTSYAIAYSEFLLQENLDSHVGSFSSNHVSGAVVVFGGIFFFITMSLPLIVVLINKHTYQIRILWIIILLLLMASSIDSIGSGGDYKGCDDCMGVVLLQLFIFVPSVSAIIFGIYLRMKYAKNKLEF